MTLIFLIVIVAVNKESITTMVIAYDIFFGFGASVLIGIKLLLAQNKG